jgi:hypothetical protein
MKQKINHFVNNGISKNNKKCKKIFCKSEFVGNSIEMLLVLQKIFITSVIASSCDGVSKKKSMCIIMKPFYCKKMKITLDSKVD